MDSQTKWTLTLHQAVHFFIFCGESSQQLLQCHILYNVPAVDCKLKQKSEKTYFLKFTRAVEASKEAMADQQRSGQQIN